MESFQRLKVIGKGSYGEVWLALHAIDKKQYVLKKMELRKASRREQKAAEQEAKLLSKLKHPNIVAYKDSFETDDGLLWIAMGYCEGGDLYTYLKGCKGALLDERQIVEWFVQISMALQYLHERNVLHRDLKTQNIFLTRSRIIKVGDLGIARVLESESDMATTLIGTPYYMSPELFANKPYNHKSDVWALGCCVHEMATLRHAFNAKDMNSLVYKILRGRTPPMPDQYSHDLAQLVKAMLSQNPARRPSVAKILRDPYIRKNIAIFLEGTKNRGKRPASSSSDQPPASARSAVGGGSSGGRKAASPAVEGLPVRGVLHDLDTITEVSQSELDRPTGSQVQRGSSGDGSRHSSTVSSRAASAAVQRNHDDARSVPAAAVAALRSGATPSPRPRQAEAARATPPSSAADRGRSQPSAGSAAPSAAGRQRDGGSGASKPASTPPARRSVDEPEDTSAGEPLSARGEPGLSSTNPNLQARARRREKKSQTADLIHPSAVPAAAAADRSHDDQPPKRQHSATHSPARAERGPAAAPQRARAEQRRVSAASEEDGGRDDEEAASESAEGGGGGGGDGLQAAAAAAVDRDMAKLTTLLDATLNMQPDIEDEEDDGGAAEEEDEPTLVPLQRAERPVADGRTAATASAAAGAAARPTPAARVAVVAPSFGKETLGSTTRLNDRIAALHRDCVRGVGFERLHKAYQILSNFEDDEVEARLRELLGGDLFDEYAGKIWQLKFCEESAFSR